MNVTGIVFTNDASLGELTTKRTMASLPFGGRYRQVDWALSNLACAGVRHIGIISRHNFQSLMNHIGDGEEWGLELEEGGLEFLTPYAQSEVHRALHQRPCPGKGQSGLPGRLYHYRLRADRRAGALWATVLFSG